MRKNLTSLIFVCLFAVISIKAQTVKPSSILADLLDLPAPPAVIPVKEKAIENRRPEEFYDEKKIPSDDAPIEDLLDYRCGTDHERQLSAAFGTILSRTSADK